MQARAALGGDSKLAKVQGLSATGTLAREMGDRQVTGELTIDVQLPDKMVRTDSMSPMGDATIVLISGVNGETLIRNSKTLNAGPGLMVRMPAPPAAGSDAETQALRSGARRPRPLCRRVPPDAAGVDAPRIHRRR